VSSQKKKDNHKANAHTRGFEDPNWTTGPVPSERHGQRRKDYNNVGGKKTTEVGLGQHMEKDPISRTLAGQKEG